MNNILNFLKPNNKGSEILLCIILILLKIILPIVIVVIIHYIQCRIHEYGHVLRLKKEIYKNISDYKEEINLNTVNIKVAKFKGDYKIKEHIDYKIKTYSDYFIYLQNKKQEFKYQNIIKDIAISGYQLNKQVIMYIPFLIVYFLIWIATLIPVTANVFSIIHKSITGIIFLYLLVSIDGYGPNKIKSKITVSDRYIYSHPNEFRYITLEEDKKLLQRDYKILLNIEIDLTNPENPKINIVSKSLIYKLLIIMFPLDD